ncbi:LacI family DNA-binding transcriptional regulator [Pseudomonas huanghezhanensis]|uniref:LacI family DNA-binding transcriptional regulator n=1 Tax=Pseudomonas huanghezhanensis TaxID=3002903 RepID=UPI0022855E36|nr:LacI family DNA-binding transcriptional regulator [Pseudomonas sp. BSw22131]
MSKPPALSTKRPTISTVARQAKLSVATVDRVLNARAPVNPDTAQKVYEAAEAVGYFAARLISQRINDKKPVWHFGFLLLGTSQTFYSSLSQAIVDQARLTRSAHITCHVELIHDRSPQSIATQIHQLAERCQCLALVSFEHPLILDAIEAVRLKGVRVVSLLTDLPTREPGAYVGVDNYEVGRTAGWLIAHGARATSGSVALMLGGHRFLGHEKREAGLRSFFEEKAPGFRVLPTVITMDNGAVTEEATLELLARHADLCGVYLAGGGVEGVVSALAATPDRPHMSVILQESTQETRQAMRKGLVTLVIDSQPVLLAQALIELMQALPTADAIDPQRHRVFVPMQIVTPENF